MFPHSPHLSCPQCHQVVVIPKLENRQSALCPRCGYTLLVERKQQTEKLLAFSISAWVFLILSLPFNFLSFRINGQSHNLNLPSGIAELIAQDAMSLALISGLATIGLPGLMLLCLIILSTCRLRNVKPVFIHRVHRWADRLIPWSMAEIFLVGTLVSLIKVTDMADVTIGMSFLSFIGFTIFHIAALVHYQTHDYAIWLKPSVNLAKPNAHQHLSDKSVQQTWALLFTSALLYVPANLLPIMNTEVLGRNEPNTIVGGVIRLWESGSYPIAIIIFVASVVVPVAKILILTWLNYSVHVDIQGATETRIKYYRLVELVGRWSMIDVFVVAVLVALIQMGHTLSVHPGPAALAFCLVVFSTMLAAMTFDSRLIWFSRTQT